MTSIVSPSSGRSWPLLHTFDVECLDFGWLVGILEGEGSFITYQQCGYIHAQVQIVSTDEDVIRRVCEIVGCGVVSGPHDRSKPGRPAHKPQWAWRLGGAKGGQLMHVLQPYMSQRRAQRIGEILALTDPERTRGRQARATQARERYEACLNTPEARAKAGASKRGKKRPADVVARVAAARWGTRYRGSGAAASPQDGAS